MSEGVKTYQEARFEIGGLVGGQHCRMVGTIDYVRDQMAGAPWRNEYAQLRNAYDMTLTSNACMESRANAHDIAYIEQEAKVVRGLVPLFEQVAQEVTEADGKTFDKNYALSAIQRTRADMQETQEKFAAFQEAYAGDIAREKTTDGYAQDQRIIADTLKEVGNAALRGIPDLQHEDISLGRTIQTPKSMSLGRLAEDSRAKKSVWVGYMQALGYGG